MNAYFTEIGPLRTWAEVQNLFDENFWDRPFVFRGHADARWHLASAIERAHLSFARDLATIRTTERGLIRAFQRKLHQYVQDCPALDDVPEWLAAMQHYGAPTRLLDVTHSFFVALFFAVESTAVPAGPSAIWAFDAAWLSKRAIEMYPIVGRIFNKTNPRDQNLRVKKNFEAVFEKDRAMVHPLCPFRLNDRLTIQQGWFLAPGKLENTFVDNLIAMGNPRPHVFKILISEEPETRSTIMHRLYRMNMTRATLFPGLEGFAQSLRTLLAVPHIIAATPVSERRR